ncbi:MAG: DEAD/DEAH box helicase [Timaviella obliquedivisa GSE-PSE-MK23-08B]|jgi:SNF2 family DNA or RNA helicase|nr:DEAD/DEAH box helicase [Timaviella obliquedivisa GSE-PSE-MK23-08B]
MAILHGSWISQSQASEAAEHFFVWGETWRRIDPIEIPIASSSIPHPFAMAEEELRELLRSLHAAQSLTWDVAEFPLQELVAAGQPGTRKRKTAPLASAEASRRWQAIGFTVPTQRFENTALPQHSASSEEDAHLSLDLFSWQVQGIRLTAIEALQFLQSLPLSSVLDDENSWLGDDLRFWSHIARWQLDLSARAKFLPILENGVVRWQVLLDSAIDQAHFDRFCRQMPGACRAYGTTADHDSELDVSIAPSQGLIFDFLNSTIAAQVRAIAVQTPVPSAIPKDLPLREWLQALGQKSMEEKSERLESALAQWIEPLQQHLTPQLASFRTCFYLNPPAPGQSEWMLEYFLQAIDDPEFLVGARTVWNNPVDHLKYMGRSIEQPQESLLAGLGLASRLYPLIEPSLHVPQPQACRLNPMQVYEFLKSMAWRLQDSGFGVVLPPSLSNQQGWANRLGLRVQAETPTLKKNQRLGLQSLLNFKWELTIGGQRLSKAEFDRLVDLNSPLVEINGEWVELRQQDVKAAQTFFESRKDQMALSLEDALRISTGDTQMVEKLPVVGFEANGALQELINALTSGNQNVEAIAIPDTFQGELRPYQVRGASWLAFLERWGLGACLADDMGLGKTIQLITLMLHLKAEAVLEHPTLLVCPTSVLGNWERELKKFAPSLKVMLHHGDRRPQGKAFAKVVKGQDLIITSYSLVHRDTKDLQTVKWQGIVLDEAQNIKNSEAKQSQAVRQLETQFRIALTGTPVENRLSELWSILDFLNPGYLGPRNFFQRRFAIPIERYGDTASLQTLRGLVQPFILRRLKTDRSIIQDLPDKQEMTVFCGLTAEQAALYQKLVDQSLVDIESAEGIQRHGLILALLVRLKQVCNHPGLLKGGSPKGELGDTALQVHSGKLQRLEEMLEEVLAEGDRCLIFTQFAEWGKLLQAHLHQRFNREVLYLYGSTSKKQREEMVDRFQNDPQAPRIFILSLKAGGVGLNLTRANHVFHFDRWWNPAVENQATDRVFRIGQTRNVQVHKFVCTGTLEERIHELIESKKALSEQVVGAGESWLTELGTDQLRSLLLLDRTAVIED